MASKLSDLKEMLTAYDALKMPKSGAVRFYLSQAAPPARGTAWRVGELGTYQFCRDNAPVNGGPWVGKRCFASTPWYQWPFNGADDIHTGDYGQRPPRRVPGYVRWLVQDNRIAWTPLWRSPGIADHHLFGMRSLRSRSIGRPALISPPPRWNGSRTQTTASRFGQDTGSM